MAITAEAIYIVTEYVETGDLHVKLIDPAYEFNWKRKIGILKDICRAMIYLHNKGYIHRDLKSANLLVTPDWKTKVCDFGLARARPQNQEESATMTVAGTLEWMAPEVSLGLSYDQPADVFSFAMVMYEVIFRLTPPKRAPLTDYQFQIHKYNAPEDTPEGVWKLLEACSAQNPSERPNFVSILATLEEIDRAVPGKPEQSYDIKRRQQAHYNKQQAKAGKSHAMIYPKPTPETQAAPEKPAPQAEPDTAGNPVPSPSKPDTAEKPAEVPPKKPEDTPSAKPAPAVVDAPPKKPEPQMDTPPAKPAPAVVNAPPKPRVDTPPAKPSPAKPTPEAGRQQPAKTEKPTRSKAPGYPPPAAVPDNPSCILF